MEWFRDNTFFYDKAYTNFKNRMKKNQLVKEISDKLRLSVASVFHWKTSMHSQYGIVKNKRSKSGQATKTLTPESNGLSGPSRSWTAT